MHIALVGLNHRTAPIELREQLAFGREELPRVFNRLREETGLREAAILSTCNRVEIYAGVAAIDGSFDRLDRFLSAHAGIGLARLQPSLYHYTEPQSVRHLFSVVSGLDSMVLGEGEILHQVKHAYESARGCGATGKALNVLFQRALNAAKTVRTETAIGRGYTSVGAVAVELAEKIFGDLSRAVVALVGAGKIGELTLKHLAACGVREIRVMNRSLERAANLAAAYGAKSLPLTQLPAQLIEADVLISSASAADFLIRREDVAAAMPARHHRPVCLIDLGVPRNVEPALARLENVYLFDIDDLQEWVDRHDRIRQEALHESHEIIEQKVRRFIGWWQEEIADCELRTPSCLRAP